MKIANLLFNHKSNSHDNKALGVERCFIDYSKYLLSYGDEVLSVYKKGVAYFGEIEEIDAENLALKASSRGDILSIFKLAHAFSKFKPDVAICHSGRAVSLVRFARFILCRKFPIIAINHGSNVKKFLKADYILSVNQYFADAIARAGAGNDRSLPIPNMVKVPSDFEKITKPAFRRPVRLGTLGRLAKEKSFDSILKAMAILKDRNIETELVIGGVGKEGDNLINLAKDLGLEKNFKILGWVEDKKKFFEEIDIFTLTSLAETFGIVLLEAMLYSTPIVTSNSWGPEEIITNEFDGIKVVKDDLDKLPGLLADVLERVINDEPFAREMAENAHKGLFEKYTSDIVIKKLHDICEDAAKNWSKN